MIRSAYKYNRVYLGNVKAVLFDLGGTIVDKYSLAPLHALDETFYNFKIPLEPELMKRDMGNRKDVHIKKIMETEEFKLKWLKEYEQEATDKDFKNIFDKYLETQLNILKKYNEPLPHVYGTFNVLRRGFKLKIGSTTGYLRDIVDVVEKDLIKKHNIYFDATVAGEDVENGYRPRPYMIFKNLEKLNISPIQSVVKVDDTTAGITEGLEAGCWTVGVSRWSSLMNFNDVEDDKIITQQLELREEKARNKLLEAGAHYVVPSIKNIPAVIEDINRRLSDGVIP